MNTKFRILALSVLMISGTSALAKAPLQVDFNKLIDEGTLDRAELNNVKVSAPIDQAEVTNSTRRKVIDFIDMEVSVGEDSNANVVNRN